ncbi:DUF1828 domain-containing protein [Campylobacter concisus]|uniref:DUF1828 domain-containing protein n=1 Tax=Campylobacter concisus TaxID=199 RepID=UPI000CD9B37F|nr:DUF1828 domain-containing protein [Campylobacter concisus]
MLDINRLLGSYYEYLNSGFELNTISKDSFEVITPFLNRHNDNISVYIDFLDDRSIKISDGGETIQDLNLSGFEFNSQKRVRQLEIALNGFGILKNKDNELFVSATALDFARKQHNVIQALISVNDMFVPSKGNNGFFYDEVENFFNNIDARYTTNISVEGKSHLSHKFEFLISRSKQEKERLIKLLNNPKKENLKATLFTFTDLASDRSSSDKIIILNDDASDEQEIRLATQELNIKLLKWSSIKNYANYLAA